MEYTLNTLVSGIETVGTKHINAEEAAELVRQSMTGGLGVGTGETPGSITIFSPDCTLTLVPILA